MSQDYLIERLNLELEELNERENLGFSEIEVIFVDDCNDGDGIDYCAQARINGSLYHILADKDFQILEITELKEVA